MEKLVIFDLDGTISVKPEFYKSVYSGTLNELIESERGEKGLKILNQCRKNYDGRGELALFALGIPFKKWAKMLIDAPLDLIMENSSFVGGMRRMEAKKVIYTGSPREMAIRILKRVGFSEDDFDLILGWEESELFPLKWSCSPLIFSKIVQDMGGNFSGAWSVGDNWETDLAPAKVIGIKTAMVEKFSRLPDACYPSLTEFFRSFSWT
jgi:FMN phosphatase YigB (HAD superfamily)